MKPKLPRSYKLLLSLALVIGPITWLMFTEDGRRRSDLFLLHILGNPSFNIAYEKLSPAVTEALIREQFPKVEFYCDTVATAFGDRLCAAKIASFNGLPARSAQLYFAGEQLRVLQLGYRRPYHEMLERSLREGLGEPQEESTAQQPVLIWMTDTGGQVMLPAEQPEAREDAALIWLARPN
ncbi:hypothetical protein [Thiorhodovibrio frisius]|uniref:Uncharacterized protein n=1 Tax=Thiorhodovibrio frisius TaxID=631362 RepID=H8Z4V8_9GAMM|nr:hypothetical protein [Thiorhodovibrio frisius]EIC20365.1 hypothetical protein Thi970DRAFT_03994 [Thiorhodovibrio frisius]WPL21105.1 hypothetical protein Thiofri_01213 [Thiorhodovibrio frisius]